MILLLYLHKVQQPPEPPGNRVEPLRTRVGPLRVHQLRQVPICKVTVPEPGRVVLLGDVAGGVMSEAQEVDGSSDVALLLRREDGQPRRAQALLAALPAWKSRSQGLSGCS